MALNLGVEKPQDTEALAAQPGVADRIGRAIRVMRAVGLDDQAVSQADKVSDIAAQRELTAELQAVEPPVAQELPQETLGRGRFATQAASKGELARAINH